MHLSSYSMAPQNMGYYPNQQYPLQYQYPPYEFGVQAGPSVLTAADLQKLHAAIESLYEDRIYPSELYVKARLKGSVPNHILQVFPKIYAAMPCYVVGKTAHSGISL